MIRTTLKPIGGKIYSGTLEGITKPRLEVFVGPLSAESKYIGWWECVEHTDGTRTHHLFANGVLHPTPEGYSGEVVSIRGGKPKGWRAVARKGSATIRFEAI